MFKLSSLLALTVASAIALVAGESHTIHFDNSQSGAVLSTGGDYTSNGPIIGAIAYLQTGGCGFNGDSCTLVETTLINPTSAGAGSSTDISLIAPCLKLGAMLGTPSQSPPASGTTTAAMGLVLTVTTPTAPLPSTLPPTIGSKLLVKRTMFVLLLFSM
ncbi:hypothetical protein BDZ89DRAFT_1039897 [Hymenopellis radicata]|nr:hypothetical protein BDZ89DRAFT_1039897 [Hymenopellis radicata]